MEALALRPLALAPGSVLRFAGGLHLRAPRTAQFGGFSGLEVWPDGRLAAVSDAGTWLEGRLRLDARGLLAGFEAARMAPLRDMQGRPLPGKVRGDAEGLAALADGRMAVSFEQRHRVWLYGSVDGAAEPGPELDQADRLAGNEGLEALAADADGGLIAAAERKPGGGGTWVWRSQGAEAGSMAAGPWPGAVSPAFSLVGLDALPPAFGGDFVALERLYAPLAGAHIRVRRIAGAALAQGRFEGPLVGELSGPGVDNFEGVAAVATAQGARLYLISDDNFRPAQRTLLVALDWPLPPS